MSELTTRQIVQTLEGPREVRDVWRLNLGTYTAQLQGLPAFRDPTHTMWVSLNGGRTWVTLAGILRQPNVVSICSQRSPMPLPMAVAHAGE